MFFSVQKDGRAWDILSISTLGFISLIAWYVILKRNAVWAIVTEVFVCFSLLYTILFDKPPSNFVSIAYHLVLVYIPMGLAVLSVKNDVLIVRTLYFCAWPIEAICICSSFLVSSSDYSMSLGYYLLLPLLIRLDRFLISYKWYDLVIAAVDFIVILFVASRGPLLCLLAFILLRVAFSNTLSSIKKILLSVVTLVGIILIYENYVNIAIVALNLLDKLGRKSRTLNLLLAGSIQYDAGRTRIFSQYWELIEQSPAIGHGLAGSWVISTYPHNIAVEILLAYGIPVGLAILAVILYAVILGLRKQSPEGRRVALIFIAELVSLLWSGSFIMSSTFFVCMAACVRKDNVHNNL